MAEGQLGGEKQLKKIISTNLLKYEVDKNQFYQYINTHKIIYATPPKKNK